MLRPFDDASPDYGHITIKQATDVPSLEHGYSMAAPWGPPGMKTAALSLWEELQLKAASGTSSVAVAPAKTES